MDNLKIATMFLQDDFWFQPRSPEEKHVGFLPGEAVAVSTGQIFLLIKALGESISDLGMGQVTHLSAHVVCMLGIHIPAELLCGRRASGVVLGGWM